MSERAYAIGVFPAQHRDHVARPEPLLGAHHAGKNLLRDHRRIGNDFNVAETEIARAAIRIGKVLAEVIDECLVPAYRAARITIHLVQKSPWSAAAFAEHGPPYQNIGR